MSGHITRPSVRFVEHGTHKTIVSDCGSVTGSIKVSDQRTIDALRRAFEDAGWEVRDS